MIRRAAALLLALPLLYLFAAMVGAVLPEGRVPLAPDHHIALVAGPIHYDLLLPLDPAIRARFGWLGIPLDHPQARWLSIGWGARDFYTTVGGYGDVTARALWHGLTGDAAVMHASLAGDLEGVPVQMLTLDAAQHARLLDAIEAAFADGIGTHNLCRGWAFTATTVSIRQRAGFTCSTPATSGLATFSGNRGGALAAGRHCRCRLHLRRASGAPDWRTATSTGTRLAKEILKRDNRHARLRPFFDECLRG